MKSGVNRMIRTFPAVLAIGLAMVAASTLAGPWDDLTDPGGKISLNLLQLDGSRQKTTLHAGGATNLIDNVETFCAATYWVYQDPNDPRTFSRLLCGQFNGCQINYDFGAGMQQIVRGVRIRTADRPYRRPKSVILLGTNDDPESGSADWTQLGEKVDCSTIRVNGWSDYLLFENDTAYRAYGLKIEDKNDTAVDLYLELFEIELVEGPDPQAVDTVTWKDDGDPTDPGRFTNPDNWVCRNAFGTVLSSRPLDENMSVRLPDGCKNFNCPIGTEFPAVREVVLPAQLGGDLDLRGITAPFSGRCCLKGFALKVSHLTGDAVISEGVGTSFELLDSITSTGNENIVLRNANVQIGPNMELAMDFGQVVKGKGFTQSLFALDSAVLVKGYFNFYLFPKPTEKFTFCDVTLLDYDPDADYRIDVKTVTSASGRDDEVTLTKLGSGGSSASDSGKGTIKISDLVNDRHLALFGTSKGDSLADYTFKRLWIKNKSTNTEYNFVPARRISDGKVGILDTIGGHFETNGLANAVDFVAGSVTNIYLTESVQQGQVGELHIEVADGVTVTAEGVMLSESVKLVKEGEGTLVVGNANKSCLGATEVKGGLFKGSINGDIEFAANTSVALGAIPETGGAAQKMDGKITLNGNLTVNLSGGANAPGTYTLISAGHVAVAPGATITVTGPTVRRFIKTVTVTETEILLTLTPKGPWDDQTEPDGKVSLDLLQLDESGQKTVVLGGDVKYLIDNVEMYNSYSSDNAEKVSRLILLGDNSSVFNGCQINCDFGEGVSQIVRGVRIRTADRQARRPKSVILFGTNDDPASGSPEWTQLGEEIDCTTIRVDDWSDYLMFENDTAYRAYGLMIKDKVDPVSELYLEIWEIELVEGLNSQLVDTATWKDDGDPADPGRFTTPDNWVCRNAFGKVLSGQLPTADTSVRLPDGCKNFNCPIGTEFPAVREVVLPAQLGGDLDLRGITAPFSGRCCLKGFALKVSHLTGDAVISDDTNTPYELLDAITSSGNKNIVLDSVEIGPNMELVMDFGQVVRENFLQALFTLADNSSFRFYLNPKTPEFGFGTRSYRYNPDADYRIEIKTASTANGTDDKVTLTELGGGAPESFVGTGCTKIPTTVTDRHLNLLGTSTGDAQMACTFKCLWIKNKNTNTEYNFLPVRRIADGKIGVLDTVNNTFVTNRIENAADFVAGSVTNLRCRAELTDQVGELHVEVADGAAVTNETIMLSGSVKLVKEGAGTLVAAKAGQFYSGGTEVAAGHVELPADTGVKNCLGLAGSAVRVATGTTLELNGNIDFKVYSLVLAGGEVKNSSGASAIDSQTATLGPITLTADSTLAPVTSVTHMAYVDLGGHTLTVNLEPKQQYMLRGDAVFANGTVDVTNGGWFGNMERALDMRTVDLKIRAAVRLCYDVQVRNLELLHDGDWADGEGRFLVCGTYKAGNYHNNCVLQNGATLDLSGLTDIWSVESTLKSSTPVTFAPDATVTVKLGGRKVMNGQIVTWADAETKPGDKVKFVLEQGVNARLVRKPDGLWLQTGMVIRIR